MCRVSPAHDLFFYLMSSHAPSTNKALQLEANAFLERFKTLLLATVSEDGRPDCSYAPFLRDEQRHLYIFVSELAQHTKNLLANPRASLMFTAAETDSKNLFARQRLTLETQAIHIPRENPGWSVILNKMETRFGNTIELLKSLPDFHLIRFEVLSGNYVQGFAKAYALAGPGLEIIEHRRS